MLAGARDGSHLGALVGHLPVPLDCVCPESALLALSIVYHIVGIFDLHTHHTLRCPQIHNPGTGRAGLTKTDLLWLPRGEQAEAGSDADTELTSYSCSLQFHEVRYYTRTNVWHAIDNLRSRSIPY